MFGIKRQDTSDSLDNVIRVAKKVKHREDHHKEVENKRRDIPQYRAERLGTVLRNIAAFIFDLFVMIFAMFYFFRDADHIIQGVRSILPFDAEHRDTMMTQTRDLISASVTTTLLLAAIQGGIGGL